jgi:hypothetical protein
LPLLQGTAAGLVCAALWRFARGRVDVLALLGIALALAGHIAFSLVSQVFVNHGWSQLIILAWEAAVDVVLLIYLRILLHNALLDEAVDLVRATRYCSHCHNTLTAEGFCPSCGMALTAVPHHTRPAPAGAQ